MPMTPESRLEFPAVEIQEEITPQPAQDLIDDDTFVEKEEAL
jgi:hypothetical protein